ncbi:MAG: MFS transporter [Chloroflexi bacterium]|nr:MFS transporter [Chloroflexota bacterium]
MKKVIRSMAGVAAAGLALRGRKSDYGGARITAEQVPRALRAFWIDGLFASAQDSIILAYLPLLASELGASATEIGILAASQSLGAMLALYPGAIAGRRVASRRWMVVFYSGILARLLLAVAALAIAISQGNAGLYALIGIVTLRAFLGSFTVPAWTSLAADIIPLQLRARYFASRNFAIQLSVLTITPLAGLLLDHAGFPGNYIAALLAAFFLGMGATVAFALMPDPPRQAPAKGLPRVHPGTVLNDHRFRAFLLATFFLYFGQMIAGPFFNVYLKNGLGATNFEVGILTTVAAFTGLFGQLFCGDWLARRGALRISRFAIVVLPTLPLMWIFITEPWMVLGINLIGGFWWAAFGLANFQLLLDLTDEEHREEYVAVFHTAIFAAQFIAPFLGGMLIDAAGYKTTFFASGAVRLISAALFFLAVTAPRARSRGAEPAPLPA